MLQNISIIFGLCIFAYLMGGIMFARLLVKLKKSNISSAGSGNPGTTNMLRNYGFMFALLTFIGDTIKAAIPMVVTYFVFSGADGGNFAICASYVVASFAVFGHIFPVYYKFKGGKGVACVAGIALASAALVPYMWIVIVASFLLYVTLMATVKIGSVSSMVTMIVYSFGSAGVLLLHKNYITLWIPIFYFILIVWCHRANLARMKSRTEAKIDYKQVIEKDKQTLGKIKSSAKKVDDKKVD